MYRAVSSVAGSTPSLICRGKKPAIICAQYIRMSSSSSENSNYQEFYNFGPYKIRKEEVFFVTKSSYAFVNLRPVVPGHVLVSPIRTVPRFCELSAEEATDLVLAAQQVGSKIEKHFKASSLTFTIQDGPEAGQTVPHVHIHVLPRKTGDFENNDEIYESIDGKEKELKKKLDLDKDRKDRPADEMAQEAIDLRMEPQDHSPKNGRGANFSPIEDEILCKAWISVGEDVVIGVGQIKSAFWDRVLETYNYFLLEKSHGKFTPKERTAKALMNRWCNISTSISKFCGLLATLVSTNQSGMTQQNLIDEAKLVFFQTQNTTFKHESCWKVLQNSPKWKLSLEKNTKKRPKISLTNLDTCNSAPCSKTSTATSSQVATTAVTLLDVDMDVAPTLDKVAERPNGQKSEKGKRKKNSGMKSLQNDIKEGNKAVTQMAYSFQATLQKQEDFLRLQLHIEQQKIEEHRLEREAKEKERETRERERAGREKERQREMEARERERQEEVQERRDKEEKEIMDMDLSRLSEIQSLYYQARQREIMNKWTTRGRDN